MKNQSEIYMLRELDTILQRHPREERFALALLQDVQNEYHYLPKAALYEIADYLNMPVGRLYSMATFYKALSLKKKGDNIIKVCDGTACHIRSSLMVIEEIGSFLEIRPGDTTADGRFSLETVNCLGACALAPVMVVNHTVYGALTPAGVREILGGYGGRADG